MAAGTRTFGFDETFIEPKVLPPPPTRHALFAFLLVLTAILHIGTAGWSEIANGAEGHYAGGAREMLRGETWLPPRTSPSATREAPFTYWLLVASYKIFGVLPMAARLPIAGAMLASVAFTFLIGERLGGYWRGFVAGLLHVCSLGAFVPARIVTPEPIFAALLGAAIFCAIYGYQSHRRRSVCFAGVWICAALLCLTKGFPALLYLVALLLLLAAFFREARLRFRGLLRWPYLLVFFTIVLPSFVFARAGLWGGVVAESGASFSSFLGAHLFWWFPGLLLILPGLCFASRRILRPHEFEFADALPLCWGAIGFVPLLIFPSRQDYDSISMWSAFALMAAWAWDRTPGNLRVAGIGLVTLVAIASALHVAYGPVVRVYGLPYESITAIGPLLFASALVLAIAGFVSAYFAWRDRETFAITILLIASLPLGISIAEGVARCGRILSLAPVVADLGHGLSEDGEVLYEGSAEASSSLRFYLDRPYSLVHSGEGNVENGSPSQGSRLQSEEALEKFRETHPVFLVIQKGRIPYWQERLTERFHLYHQVTACGDHVVLSNTP